MAFQASWGVGVVAHHRTANSWRIVTSAIVSFAAVYNLSLFPKAVADLPIHATVSDITGTWLFSLSPPTGSSVHSCGSTLPNKNTTNLRPELSDYKSFLETHGGIYKQVRLLLTDKPVPFAATRSRAAAGSPNRQAWKSLGVFDGSSPSSLIGSWTTVYDEGFEVDVNDKLRMMGFMKYSLDPTCKASPRDGDLEDRSGNTKCYTTDPRRTHMGWYIQQTQNGDPALSGCFYAERVDAPAANNTVAFVTVREVEVSESASFSSDRPENPLKSRLRQKQQPLDLAYYVSQEFIDSHNASPTATWRAGLNPIFAQLDTSTLAKYIKNSEAKKLYRGGSVRYPAGHSFLQSGNDSTAPAHNSNQLYACPCKKGDRPLDTRREQDKGSTPVLSPFSALEFEGKTSFLAAIAPHIQHSSSLSQKQDVKKPLQSSSKSFEAPAHERHGVTADQRRSGNAFTAPLTLLETLDEDLPANFSWSDPFSSPSFNEEVSNQGACGSCYAVAATYALQKRFEIAASRILGKEVKLFGSPSKDVASDSDTATSFLDLREEAGAGGFLSAQSVLSCSFYNQGCDGGFPFLVGRHAKDIGIPQERCMSYKATDSAACPLQYQQKREADIKKEPSLSVTSSSMLETESRACMSDARWYASDYGYVGGCYECNHCAGEKLIMKEVQQSGPVAVALEVPPSLFSYHKGIYDVDTSTHPHSRVCDVNNPQCSGLLTGWEFTNHAVTIVGWGEEAPEKGGAGAVPKKFWIVRNTWGPFWGEKGYVKIARGKNLGGIESQATWIDPDLTRGMGKELAQKLEALRDTTVASA